MTWNELKGIWTTRLGIGIGAVFVLGGVGAAGYTLLVNEHPLSTAPCSQERVDHAPWNALLQDFVSEGRVDYRGLLSRRDALQTYLKDLGEVCDREFNAWSRDEQLAFLFNAYNAYMVNIVLDNHPLESVTEIGFAPGHVFLARQIPLRAVSDRTISLHDLESAVILERFKDPRVHFALVCAAKGCPPLRNEAYDPGRLDEQLEAQAAVFINDPTKNWYEQDSRTLFLSKVFFWHREDFETSDQSLLEFVSPYLNDAWSLPEERVTVDFSNYDWSLNGS